MGGRRAKGGSSALATAAESFKCRAGGRFRRIQTLLDGRDRWRDGTGDGGLQPKADYKLYSLIGSTTTVYDAFCVPARKCCLAFSCV